jgi:hypothetical protein
VPTFIPGLKLAELFYREAVRPILAQAHPDLSYSAALIGSGSEVQGYDTPRSMDHHWGPRLQLFIEDDRHGSDAPSILSVLSERLPPEVHGIPTNFGQPDEHGVRLLQPVESGPVQHMIEVTTIRRFFAAALGLDPHAPLTTRNWLVLPQQCLLEVTAGRVFHDDLGLDEVRARFAWYPHDVWLYLMAGQWARIGQEEAFVGRTGDVGDELGSAVIAARLVRDLMRLVFLIERRYAPYSKWIGTAFSRLDAAPRLEPALRAALAAGTWREREAALSEAYGVAAGLHNDLGITEPLPTAVSPFHERPYQVIHGERFVRALTERIGDPFLRSLPPVGGIDQISDNTDVLSNPAVYHALSSLYDAAPSRPRKA